MLDDSERRWHFVSNDTCVTHYWNDEDDKDVLDLWLIKNGATRDENIKINVSW